MDVKHISYLAGLIDADGCVALTRNGDRRVPSLSFVNTSRELVKLFEDRYGGYVYEKQWKTKPTFEWNLRDRQSLQAALTELIPELILKKKKAEILLKYVETIISNRDRKVGYDWKIDRAVLGEEFDQCKLL